MLCAEKRINIYLKDIAVVLTNHGRHALVLFLNSLPIPVLRNLEEGANTFYDRDNKSYNAALLTRCYVQHLLRPFWF